ncbi:hypothetical protein MY805_04095 [Haemophilus influenzae]|uniref:hypothetical protein n=1 Tax=Haemophilus influenzae TaxID=727 RepID=UPI001F441068|nr:hypothetical protein [Haemophilus influenzae]
MNKRVIIISNMRMLFLFLLIDKRRLGDVFIFSNKVESKIKSAFEFHSADSIFDLLFKKIISEIKLIYFCYKNKIEFKKLLFMVLTIF